MKRFKILFTIILIFSITLNVNAVSNGWRKIGKNTYYYQSNSRITGLVTIKNKHYYFNKKGVLQKNKLLKINNEFYYATKDGSFALRWKTVKKKKYYFDPSNGKAFKGYHDISGKKYYFYAGSAALRKGFHKIRDNIHYSDGNGVVQTGWTTVKGKKYFFNEEYPYQAYKGYHTINDKLYYFYAGSGVLRTGFHKIRENTHYSNGDGVVQTGWTTINGKRYYFNEEYPYQGYKGFVTLDGALRYFYNDGELRVGFQKSGNDVFYSNGEGVVQTGWQTIGGRRYYFYENQPYRAARGFVTMDEKKLFFDPSGRLVTGKQIVNGNEYFCTDEGEFIKVNYIPKYYNQKDNSWTNKKYGKYLFGRTGCTPTSLAMAYQSILERQVLPTTVGDYLYNQTKEFNRTVAGTRGRGIIYASQKFNVKTVPILNIEDMKTYLNNGNILYAAMQNGKFATKDWNHAIILYRLNNNNQTYALDPLKSINNGYVDINLIWSQKSTDSDDTSGGSAIYALLPNV